MVRLSLVICLLGPVLSLAQPTPDPQDEKKYNLPQRYWMMKSKAETYQEYKVIKEYVLDGVWKAALDSITAQKHLVAQGHQTISKLETDLRDVRLTLSQEREAATQIVYDSAHLSLLGIHFKKNVFIILIAAIFSLLFFVGSGMIAKIKLLQATAKEKTLVTTLVTQEFDEFKKKAMEKQIKIARELQNERNKLADLKQSMAH